jgi:carbamoylphosphate synthase large subunit
MKLAHEGFLEKHGVRLIGTNAEAIDRRRTESFLRML